MSEQTEAVFLRDYSARDFDAPLCTVDVAVFAMDEGVLKVLLVRRADHPFRNRWALPGGFPDLLSDTGLHATALRKLFEKTGLRGPYLEQVESVGNATRDPRGWSITLLYFALADIAEAKTVSADAQWFSLTDALAEQLAFDHDSLLRRALSRLRSKTRYTALPVHLMPDTFTLTELQQACETILGHSIEKKSFRRRLERAAILEETGELRPTSRRPAMLYRVGPGYSNDFIFPGILDVR